MKVLIATGLFPPESGGPATYSKVLLDELPKRGIEVEILPFREVRKYPNVIRQIVYAWLVFWRGRKVDLIYAQDTTSVGWPACFANFFLRKKFVVRIPGDQVWEQGVQRFNVHELLDDFPKWSKSWHAYLTFLRFLQQITVSRADHVVVPSRYLAKVVQKWEIEKKKISVVYNSIEPVTVGLKQVIRGLLKFKGELIISSGRLVPWKGFDVLIRIVAKLKKNRPDLKLLIVGGGPDDEKLESLAKELGVEDSVIFTHRVENAVALRYMRAADVFVLNTKYEGFSHTLLEAAIVGVPIVTTKIGGNPEFIDDSINGYLIKPDDEKTFEKRITALLDSPTLRTKISGAAKRKVEKFSVNRMVDETESILRKV